MDVFGAAERALVAGLVLGAVDGAELPGRLAGSDFADPAAALVFDTVLQLRGPGELPAVLPAVLRARGLLRGDGYPLTQLAGWLPVVPVPAHPSAWAGLVVAGSLARLVSGCGTRLMQASESAVVVGGAGRVLAVGVAQQAAVRSAVRRWAALPTSWRTSLPTAESVPASPAAPKGLSAPGWPDPTTTATATATATSGVTRSAAAGGGGVGACGDGVAGRDGLEVGGAVEVERELLAAVLAAPVLLHRIGWLRSRDFAGAGHAAVWSAVTRLHESGCPVDVVTVHAALTGPAPTIDAGLGDAGSDGGAGGAVEVLAEIDPATANPAWGVLLARQVLTGAVLRTAHGTGRRLHDLGAAPARAGLGGLMLHTAQDELQALSEHGQRWQHAHVRPARGGREPDGQLAPRGRLTAVPTTASRWPTAVHHQPDGAVDGPGWAGARTAPGRGAPGRGVG